MRLKATEQPIDTSTAAGKAFLNMLGVFAEFETNLRTKRRMEGIAKAKAEGVYKGRKLVIDPAKVRELQAAGLGATEIAAKLGIGRACIGCWDRAGHSISRLPISSKVEHVDHLEQIASRHPIWDAGVG